MTHPYILIVYIVKIFKSTDFDTNLSNIPPTWTFVECYRIFILLNFFEHISLWSPNEYWWIKPYHQNFFSTIIAPNDKVSWNLEMLPMVFLLINIEWKRHKHLYKCNLRVLYPCFCTTQLASIMWDFKMALIKKLHRSMKIYQNQDRSYLIVTYLLGF